MQCVMHYGLHIGEAIEGALGSANKIDATYLSPNVNLASRLEAACHQFSVDFLMSGVLVNLFSDGIRKLCRQVPQTHPLTRMPRPPSRRSSPCRP